ncbi:MAG TPA: amino acid adenylation domain-containing protein [Symbiobacteriaceae bacterium]|nr:amino acid adenylation domain-containing protein [Symbiobacteriaceae bacterium]
MSSRVTNRLADLSAEQRARALALREQRLQGASASGEKTARRISPAARDGAIPLSSAQQRMWFLELMNPGSPAYNVFSAVSMTGHLDVGALEQAIHQVVSRHEVLRTTYASVGGRPVQVIAPALQVPVVRVDLQAMEPAAQEEAVRRLAAEAARHTYDLMNGPLFRGKILVLAPDRHVLLMVMHHSVADGWSIGVLVRELATLYSRIAAANDKDLDELPELPVQYADYAVWQQQWLEGEGHAAQMAYWKKQLAGAHGILAMPTDRPRPPVQSLRGANRPVMLPAQLSDAVRQLSLREGVTPFMTLLAAFNLLLARYTGQTDLLVGSPIANRGTSELEPLIGLFANTVVLRNDVSGNPTVRDLLQRVRQVALEAYAHQDVPFEKLVEELAPQRDLSTSPLVQAVFVLQNAPTPPLELPGVTMALMPVENDTAKFDITLALHETAEGLAGYVEYSTDLFDAATIDRLIGHYQTLLSGMVANPDAPVETLPLLTEAEHRDVQARVRDVRTFAAETCLPQRFEEQAARTPNAVAVVLDDQGERQTLTYGELNQRANQVAHALRKEGVGPEVRVAIYLPRSLEMVVAILAVLKAGGAYVPLDSSYPQERLAYILADAQVGALVTMTPWDGASPLVQADGRAVPVLYLDKQAAEIAAESTENPVVDLAPDHLAYVIYTSGSTGRPKGVLVEHRQVMRLLAATEAWYGFGADDVWTLFHSYAFDFSVWEIWGALLYGGRLVVVPYMVSRSPEAFYQLLSQERVTVLNQTPSAFRQLIAAEQEVAAQGHGLPELALRWVIFGGEALDLQSLRPWFERHGDVQPQLVNMYGITETTVHVTYRPLRMADVTQGLGSVIGVPIPDLQVLVVDAHGQPVPLGVPGEMMVGGAGVVRGYLNRPDLTAERFVTNPLGTAAGGRWYRSGDLARWLPGGDLEYLGRIDNQVKIRGFRIELGEIEAALSAHPAVRENHVMAYADPQAAPSESKRLVAYVVLQPESGVTITDLRHYLQGRLPEYMVPALFVTLDSLPLTPNGKVDRRALPAPTHDRSGGAEAYVAPRTPAEEVLSQIFAQVLGLEQVGVHDNFFALGGDSIRSVRVVALAKERGIGISLQQVFQHQTVGELAVAVAQREPAHASSGALTVAGAEPFSLVAEADRAKLPPGLEDAYPLTKLQAGMLFHMNYSTTSSVYHNVTGFHVRAPFDATYFQEAVRQVVARHSILRTSFDLTHYSEPLQLVHPTADLPVAIEDLRHLSGSEQDEALAAFVRDEQERHFDLAQPPLLRLTIHLRDEATFQFTATENHAILDGWSFTSTIGEIFERYTALLTGNPVPPQELPAARFRDFVALEQATMGSAESEQFWLDRLSGYEAGTVWRWPRREGAAPSEAAARHGGNRATVNRLVVPVSPEIYRGLKSLARSAAVPFKSVLLAAHVKVASMVTGRTDLVTGLVCNGRPEEAGGDQVRGLFLNTVPFRQQVTPGSWEQLVKQVFESEWSLLPHRRFPLMELQKRLDTRQALFETSFNYVHFYSLGQIEILDLKEFAETNFPLLITASVTPDSGQLRLILDYDGREIPAEQAGAVMSYYVRVLTQMATQPGGRHELAPVLSAKDLAMVGDGEMRSADPSSMGTIHQAFAAQARRTPDAVAVTAFDGAEEGAGQAIAVTYDALNRRANQVAHALRKLGVGPEERVGLCVERSLHAVLGALGILKAGGAYVPLDPALPSDRLDFMMEDAGVKVIVAQQATLDRLPERPGVQVLCIDDLDAIGSESDADPAEVTTGGHLAYVIYTSGSTGRPKGVLVEHRQVMRLFTETEAWYEFNQQDVWTLFHSYAFDFSVWEIWGALLYGGRLVVVPYWVSRSPASFYQLLRQEGVTVLNQTPSAFRQLIAAEEATLAEGKALGLAPLALRYVIFGGEALELQSLRPWFERHGDSQPQLVNMYGITETTVHVTYRPIGLADLAGAPGSVIGVPIPDLRVYVLDRYMQPVPTGVPGEMFVGGAGVARGYLNRPDLAADRFVPNPFTSDPNARLYKTGDLARWLPDGDLEYLGRIDNQVKIRGFRIELGEIESILSQHPGLRESAVLVREDQPGDKRLVGYLSCRQGATVTVDDLRKWVQERLPDYMVPAAFVVLETLPLNNNGKVDRKALPAPSAHRPQLAEAYASPRTPAEEVLAQIWADILGLAQVGIHDNFFAIGGDSIMAMRIVAKAHQRGFIITPKQIFEGQTVAQVALVAGVAAPSEQHLTGPAQGVATGPVPLTPIQHWFFQQEMAEPHHFNQAMMFEVEPNVATVALAQAVQQVATHHDALRLRFTMADGVVDQAYADPQSGQHTADTAAFAELDLSAVPAAEQAAAVEAAAASLQTSFNLERGPLMRVTLIHLGQGKPARLWLGIHHLVVDAVSWRILLDDLGVAYDQAIRGALIELPPKTTSFQQWAQRLVEYSQSAELRREIEYWQEQSWSAAVAVPVDRSDARNDEESAATITVRLTVDETRALLQEVPKAYGTQVHEALLAALAYGFARWTSDRVLLVDVEGHGREQLWDDVDLTRTVGWFTSLFPMLFDLRKTYGVAEELKAVKEAVRRIPNKGFGYGVLRYLAEPAVRTELAAMPRAQVAFNYLGQFQTETSQPPILRLAPESVGPSRSQRGQRPYLLQVDASVMGGRLEVQWGYSREIHRVSTIENLAQAFMDRLRQIIAHCTSPEAGGYTPSDFPEARLSQTQMDDFFAKLMKSGGE